MQNSRSARGKKPLAYEEALERLENVTPTVDGHQAKCPLHESKNGANLSVKEEGGKLLMHCFAQGCSFENIVSALSEPKHTKASVYSTSGYEWEDPAGNVVAVHRHRGPWYTRLSEDHWVGKKTADTTLYNLPAVLAAVGKGEQIFFVEGEKDVETLRDHGLTATTTGGAKSWRPECAMFLRGAHIVQLPDNDDAGKEYAASVYKSLLPVAASIKVVPLPDLEKAQDVSDWFAYKGGTREKLLQNVKVCNGSQFPFPKYMVGNGNKRIVQLSGVPRPKGVQPFLIDRVVPEAFPTVFFGDSGTYKTTLAAHLGLSVASGAESWLGFEIRKQVPTLFIDFELDQGTFLRKLHDLAAGLGLAGLPDGTHYIEGAGYPTKETFEAALQFSEEEGIGLVIVDSLGIAMDGEMDSAKTVVDFMHSVMDKFRHKGTTAVMVDHQGKLQMGENYQSKTQYGNSFKKHLVRSQFQVEGKDGGLTIRHKKTNFGPLQDPFGAEVTFEHEQITVQSTELTQAEMAEEATINISKRILIALEDGPEFTDELAENLNAQHKTVSNRVSDLVKAGKVQTTGVTRDRYQQVALAKVPQNGKVCNDSQNTTPPKGTGIGNECIPGQDSPHLKGKTPADPETPQEGGVQDVGNEPGNERLPPTLGDVITTDAASPECVAWLQSIPSVALDIETYGKTKTDATSYLKGTVRLLTFHHGGEARVVDLHGVSDQRAAEMLEAVKDKPKYLHNAVFDLPRLYRRTGVLLKNHVYDTMLASRTARAGETERTGARKGHDLRAVLLRELGVEVDKGIDHKWGEPLTPERLSYAVEDVAHLEELHRTLERLLERRGVKERYEAVRATLPTFLKAAASGVPVDAEKLEGLSASALSERGRLREVLDSLAPEHPEGGEWTWNSNKNTGAEGSGRSGAIRALEVAGVSIPNIQDQTLLDHRDAHPLVGALQDYRKKAQEYSKYRRWLPDFCEDSRIYPQPKVAGAVTSRLLYSDPNIQGVEKHKTKEYRKVIAPGAGRSIVAGDFAQQELRIAALISGDQEMIQAFAGGEDIYLRTASKMVGEKITDKNHPARAGAKRATLGFLYGLGVDKYRENTYKDYGIALSHKQAKADREAFRAAFPGFYKWQQEYGALNDRETRSILGWRRVVGQSTDRKGNTVPKYTDRLNGPIQSTAGDVLYLALAKMQEDWARGEHADAKFLMGVHDEIVLEAPEASAESVARWLHVKMREAFEEVLGTQLGGPHSVEVSYGPSWGEQRDVQVDDDER
jgi:DNA polymerase I-like protein with 3'-5' exonuclease and polymerase domains